MSVITEPLQELKTVCAYCGGWATHVVASDDGRLVGFCCAEPTHWAWLVESVEKEDDK